MRSSRIFIAFIFFTTLLLTVCGGNAAEEDDKTTINVGTSPGPYSELFMDPISPILEEDGFTLETTDFTELLQAYISLDEGYISLNVDQHTIYYKNFNDTNVVN